MYLRGLRAFQESKEWYINNLCPGILCYYKTDIMTSFYFSFSFVFAWAVKGVENCDPFSLLYINTGSLYVTKQTYMTLLSYHDFAVPGNFLFL